MFETPISYVTSVPQSFTLNPNSWGLGKRPAHQYVVKEATMRRQVLHRAKHGHPQSPMRPAIWADSTDGQRSGLRAIEAHWASTAAGAGSSQQSLGKRQRGEPDPSSHAAWMRPPPKRPPPWRDRAHAEASAPAPRTPRQPSLPDTVDAAAITRGPQQPWAHVWRVIDTSHLDRGQRMTVWRLLHGKLFVGAFCSTFTAQIQQATIAHIHIAQIRLPRSPTSSSPAPLQRPYGAGLQLHGQLSQGRNNHHSAQTSSLQTITGHGSQPPS